MSFNGTGTFLINTTGQPVVTGTVISSTAFNAFTADVGTGLSTCITKDGQTTVTANIPMSGFKITGLGVPTTAGDALRYGSIVPVASGGTGSASVGAVGNVLTSDGTNWVTKPNPAISFAIVFGL